MEKRSISIMPGHLCLDLSCKSRLFRYVGHGIFFFISRHPPPFSCSIIPRSQHVARAIHETEDK